MNVSDEPPSLPPAGEPSRTQGRSGGVTAVLILIGIVLLLPGVCSVIFMATVLHEDDALVRFGGFWFLSLALAAGGIWLIRYARRS